MFLREFNNSAPQNKVNENFITDKLTFKDAENTRLSHNLFNIRKLRRLLFV
ncbi:hypothetical protein FLJU110815_06580 [Flavobacterium jumunjinense]